MQDRTAGLVLVAWLLAAAAFVATGGLAAFAPPFPQIVLVALTLLLFSVYAASRPFRNWVDRLPSRSILALHTVRFVGLYFLVLHADGQLPWDFAVLGGWGDILVAAAALALLLAYRGSPPASSVAFQIWNAIGLADIVSVVVFAARNALAEPRSMAPLLELPLGLLPTFVVPLIVFTHGVVIVRRIRRTDRQTVHRNDRSIDPV